MTPRVCHVCGMELREQDVDACQVCAEQPNLEPVGVSSKAHVIRLYRPAPQPKREEPEGVRQ